MTVWHLVGHATVAIPAARGVDASAWVSAGAAVVQAVGAVVTIWYTGKAAREAANREAVAADRLAAERMAAHDRTVDRAVDLGELVIKDLTEKMRGFEAAKARQALSMLSFGSNSKQELALGQLQDVGRWADDIALASDIKALETAVALMGVSRMTPTDWVPALQSKIADIRDSVEAVRRHRIKASTASR